MSFGLHLLTQQARRATRARRPFEVSLIYPDTEAAVPLLLPQISDLSVSYLGGHTLRVDNLQMGRGVMCRHNGGPPIGTIMQASLALGAYLGQRYLLLDVNDPNMSHDVGDGYDPSD